MRIYTAESARRKGDSFTLCVSYDRSDAERAAENDRYYMTAAERAATVTSVQSFDVDTLPGEAARAAWERLLDADEWPTDPAEYVEIE